MLWATGSGGGPEPRSSPRRLPPRPVHSPRLPLRRHPQPWGSGPLGHLTVCAGDRATLFSKPLTTGPQALPASLCSPQSQPHWPLLRFLSCLEPPLRPSSPSSHPWLAPSRDFLLLGGQREAAEAGVGDQWTQDRASGPSPGVDVRRPGPSRHPEPCSAQVGRTTEGGQAQAPRGNPLSPGPHGSALAHDFLEAQAPGASSNLPGVCPSLILARSSPQAST